MKENKFSDAIENANILLRTRPELHSYVMNYLGEIARMPEARFLIVQLLGTKPAWRREFLDALPQNVPSVEAQLDLLLGLKEIGSPPMAGDLISYLNFLIRKKRPDAAYNTWLQFVPQHQLTSLGLLNNAAFADDPSGLPFDWTLQRGQNTTIDFPALSDESGGRALRLAFGVGRIRFPELSQILLLAPGRYRFTGVYQGLVTGKRGFRWEFRCLEGLKTIAETEMIYGAADTSQIFSLDIDVPDIENCQAQRLRLYHHARSPSEELISGQILFRKLSLIRLPPLG